MNIEQYRKVLIKRNTTHGASKTTLYGVWHGINNRCNNGNSQDYSRYGGRGIRCEWNSFQQFSFDMKRSYNLHVKRFGLKNTSIDRIDVNGNYSRNNCQWATWHEQSHNRRNNRKFTKNGETKTIAEWAEIAGMLRQALRYRLDHGLAIEEATELAISHANKYGD